MPLLALVGLILIVFAVLGFASVVALGFPASAVLLAIGVVLILADPGVRTRL